MLLYRLLEWVIHPTQRSVKATEEKMSLTSSHLDLIAFFRYTDPARRTERSWEESSAMLRRLRRNEACALRVARFCSACFLVDGFKDASSSRGTSDMFASKGGNPSKNQSGGRDALV